MGQTQAKAVSITEVVNKIVTNIVVSNEQKCITESKNIQNLKIGNIASYGCTVRIGAEQTIELNSDVSCIQKLKSDADMSSDFASQLDSAIKTQVEGGMGLTTSETSVISQSVADIKTNVDISSISTCITDTLNQQNLQISGLKVMCAEWQTPAERILDMSNVKQHIIQNQVVSCMQENTAVADAASKIDNILKNKVKSKVSGSKIALGLGGGGGTLSISSSSCILFLIIAVIMSMPKKGKGKGKMPMPVKG
jgi:hypothetical protein